jgi:LmbE family N-acetylglucosaminyl deacetylase
VVKKGMLWVYLSPHFDDVALSCGGLVWEQIQAGEEVQVWTVCAGEVPAGQLSPFVEELHARWQVGSAAITYRRREDIAACARLGASYRHFDLPDGIYRTDPSNGVHLYSAQNLFAPYATNEQPLVVELSQQLDQLVPALANLVCPLTVGGHVDHRLVRAAVELAFGRDTLRQDAGRRRERRLWYYADYPYVINSAEQVEALVGSHLEVITFQVSGQGLVAWQEAVAAHTSQVSSFWPDLQSMCTAIQAYRDQHGGLRLWREAIS